MNDLCALDAVSLTGTIRRREVSAVEATRAAIARMDALEPVLHAFCTPTPDLALKMIGLQIIGRHLDDRAVLRAAAAFEAARPWRDRVPPMVAALDKETRP